MLILLAIVFLFVLPDPWNLVGFIVVTVLWFGELFLWSRKVRNRPARTGVQTLVGKHGVVTETCRPDGQVRVDGEIWAAHCEAGASVGDAVHVLKVDGLIAVVEPISA